MYQTSSRCTIQSIINQTNTYCIMKILYMLYKSKCNKRGLCPIRCRMTFLKVRKEFSTGLFINPDYWNIQQQEVLETFENSNYTNTQLSLIRQKLHKAFLFLQVQEIDFDVKDIYNQYKGELPKKQMTLLRVFKLHNEKMKSLIGIDIVEVTYQKYLETETHICRFIRSKYKENDVELSSLKVKFLDNLSYYLKTERRLQQSTVNKVIQRLRKVVKYAVAEDYLVKNPFTSYSYKTVKKEIIFLTSEELKRLEESDFKIERLNQIRDCFVFCCYTGLAFKEMANLKKDNIVKGFDGLDWIKIKRQKTNSVISIPLLPKAKSILEKYNHILPVVSNQRFNGYLKEIADLSGINKNLTHHIARKTFATTVLLYNDVPMEIVSKLLGHSRMGITQAYYGKILEEKVSEAMRQLMRKNR